MVRSEPDTATTAILLNTGGGIAGGDVNRIDITAAPRTALTLSSQGAERIYRAGIGDLPSRITTRIAIGAAATLEYLPQETILFDNAGLNRSLRIDLAGSARYLGIESLIFGRAAMGETIAALDLTDTVELHRDDALVFRDKLRPPREFAAAQTHRAMFGGASAIATILLASPDAASFLDAVRDALSGRNPGVTAGVSAWNGLLLVRLLAQTGAALRVASLRVLSVLRQDRPMPRVWGC
ncbi:urease accessory protein UreD [Acidiphilium sp. PA]|uniref:urease accessory protein UreD n=1 Tax=Acidiphilium sp. PA TaxID=2871705 RepID=UPI002244E976|nr:urease accessory protein UreD [Acidiphilium sp. PA]MCW8305789.1 urease accessory protein UreD [Acidiphilium sp. PA]